MWMWAYVKNVLVDERFQREIIMTFLSEDDIQWQVSLLDNKMHAEKQRLPGYSRQRQRLARCITGAVCLNREAWKELSQNFFLNLLSWQTDREQMTSHTLFTSPECPVSRTLCLGPQSGSFTWLSGINHLSHHQDSLAVYVQGLEVRSLKWGSNPSSSYTATICLYHSVERSSFWEAFLNFYPVLSTIRIILLLDVTPDVSIVVIIQLA